MESKTTVWARRAITFPTWTMALLAAVLTLPAWLTVAFLVDVFARGRLALARAGLFFTWLLGCEVLGLFAAGALYTGKLALRPPPARWVWWNFRLQRAWARALFAGVKRLFSIRVHVEGGEHVATGPLLVLVRHVSVADTLLPAVLISDRFHILLRYVLKRELLWDPCLDVVGRRLPNTFVRRGTGVAEEAARVGTLAKDLTPMEGVLIFPEGTRFTPDKRKRVLGRLRAQGDNPKLLAAAENMTRVLPPRLGGALQLLEGAPRADVVLCAHSGFEGISTLGDIWTGSLVRREVKVRFWRVSWQDVPKTDAARQEWLLAQWARVDAWLVGVERAASLPA